MLKLTACHVDLVRNQVIGHDMQERPLTTREAELLAYFVQHPSRPIGRDEILHEIWGFRGAVVTRAVDATMLRLRNKLERNPSDPDHLFTVYGFGYRFEPGESTSHAETFNPATAIYANPFVGRQELMGRLDQAAHAGSRLITLAGVGGIGKSRLAHEWVARKDQPVWICDFSHTRTIKGIAHQIVEASGIRDPEDTAEGLLAKAGPLLIVLDNIDPIVSELARLIPQWLHHAPETTFVVTSRERLRIRGERCFEVPSLSEPEAVQLYKLRATTASSLSEIDTSKAHTTDLVNKLERLPLAVELAASWSDILGPEDLVKRLDLGCPLPPSPARDVSKRHSDLEELAAWSWDLLSDWETAAIAQLSGLTCGFTLDLAERTIDIGEYADAPSRIETFQSLRDKSLIYRAADGFRIYGFIRYYAKQWQPHPQVTPKLKAVHS